VIPDYRRKVAEVYIEITKVKVRIKEAQVLEALNASQYSDEMCKSLSSWS
jgi:hypothetical protein